MDKLQEFQQKRTEIFNAMIAAIQLQPNPLDETNATQFVNGYLSLIESALQGDFSAREDYLTLVVPPLKRQNVTTLGYSVKILFLLNTALLQKISTENTLWYTTFFSNYAESLCQIWEAS